MKKDCWSWISRNIPIAIDGDRALIARLLDTGRTEYVIADGYDRTTGHWGGGSYFDSIATAAARFEGRSISPDDAFQADYWCSEDIRYASESFDLPDTDEMIQDVISELRENDWFSERMAEEGSEMIGLAVSHVAQRAHGQEAPSTQAIKSALMERSVQAAGTGIQMKPHRP